MKDERNRTLDPKMKFDSFSRSQSFQTQIPGTSIVIDEERIRQWITMFVRFVSSEIDEQSHVSAGLFCAAFDLIDNTTLPENDFAELADLMRWFRLYLRGPFEYRLRKPWRARRSICWFKSNAHEHIKQAWQMTRVLERNDVFMRMIKLRKVGYIIYEDEAQVLAQPSADVRWVL